MDSLTFEQVIKPIDSSSLGKKSSLRRKLIKDKTRKSKKDSVEVIKAPLPEITRRKAQRRAAYKESSRTINRWAPIVSRNRQSEHLVFGDDSGYEEVSLNLFRDCNTGGGVGEEVNKILREHKLLDEHHENEEKPTLTYEEQQQRLIDLTKTRSFLFFREQKLKRASRIKSKSYRYARRRENRKRLDYEDAEDDGDEKEIQRARERITLRAQSIQKHLKSKHISDKDKDDIHEEVQRLKLLKKKIEEDSSTDGCSDEENAVCKDHKKKSFSIMDMEFMKTGPSAQQDNMYDGDDRMHREIMVETQRDIYTKDVESYKEVGTGVIDMVEMKETDPFDHEGSLELRDDSDVEVKHDLVKKIFSDDNVVREFNIEKSDVVKDEMPHEEDVTLPGWGCWSGKGINNDDKAPVGKKIIVKTEGIEPRKRKDASFRHVIINENALNTTLSTFSLKKLPYPFDSVGQYEQVQNMPIGKQWNSISSFESNITPRIQTQQGSVIRPLRYED